MRVHINPGLRIGCQDFLRNSYCRDPVCVLYFLIQLQNLSNGKLTWIAFATWRWETWSLGAFFEVFSQSPKLRTPSSESKEGVLQ